LLEPGRFLVGPSGAYLARVVDTKTVNGVPVAILDGGVHHVLRPALVGQDHRVRLMSPTGGRPVPVTIAGPLCSGLDVLSTLVLRSLVQALAARGKMIVYSSHVLEMVEQASTEVLILHESRVVAHDSVSRLREVLQLSSLEQVFRKVVAASDVDGVANGLVKVMEQ